MLYSSSSSIEYMNSTAFMRLSPFPLVCKYCGNLFILVFVLSHALFVKNTFVENYSPFPFNGANHSVFAYWFCLSHLLKTTPVLRQCLHRFQLSTNLLLRAQVTGVHLPIQKIRITYDFHLITNSSVGMHFTLETNLLSEYQRLPTF